MGDVNQLLPREPEFGSRLKGLTKAGTSATEKYTPLMNKVKFGFSFLVDS
jgi:hypothetical protein